MKGLETAFTGRVGRDAETRTTKAGKAMVTLNVAVDDDGDETTWVRVLAFGDQAQASSALTKGTELYIEGRLKLESWVAKDGTQRHGLTVLARTALPLARIGRRRPSGPTQRRQDDEAPPFDDDPPFG